MSKISRSGATEDQINEIKRQCDDLIESHSQKTGLSKFQVAKEIHYRIQRAPSYRINPSAKDKAESIKRHGDRCSIKGANCNGRREEFHHIRRDVDNPHSPENMVPVCKPCHEQESNASDEN